LASQNCEGKKPFLLGEFGFYPLPAMEKLLEETIKLGRSGGGVVGALLWSLRFHSYEGGFFWHAEPWGNDTYW
jgi:mannan endo-1,4-beta-mannosidase